MYFEYGASCVPIFDATAYESWDLVGGKKKLHFVFAHVVDSLILKINYVILTATFLTHFL